MDPFFSDSPFTLDVHGELPPGIEERQYTSKPYLTLSPETESLITERLKQAIEDAADEVRARAQQLPPAPKPTLNGTDIDIIRAMIQTAVDKALHAEVDGFVDARHFARVSFETDQGEIWRGVVYPVERV